MMGSELVRVIRYTGLVPSLADAILHVTTGTVSWKTLLTLARTYVGEAAFGTAFAAAVGNNKPSSPPPPSSPPSPPPPSQRISAQRSVSFTSHPTNTTAVARSDVKSQQRSTNPTPTKNQRTTHSPGNHRHRSNEPTLRLDSDDDDDNDHVQAFNDIDDEEDSHRDDDKKPTTTTTKYWKEKNNKQHNQKRGLTTRYNTHLLSPSSCVFLCTP